MTNEEIFKTTNNQKLSYNIVDTFLETDVSTTLKKIGDIDAQEKLNELLHNQNVKIRSYRQSYEKVTFGDLAVLIAELDLDSAKEIAKQATDIFFACFESAESVTCEELKSVHDFLHMPFKDLFYYAEQCGIPKKRREIYDIYRIKKESVDNESPLTVYREITANTSKAPNKPLIDLLALPLAIIMEIPFI
ncbi:MAG: hypothetical protein J1F37_06565 [Oscillospiraceae bacterium]|nr:hypothetical protein [Oscillospiraceae bacterium]